MSSGLDIVRKTLGQHEIATVQTTAIDQTAGLVNLTTVLAHASGEWVASDWPVCAIADTATPHRMGAALTYAHRYTLFTLVGIAGEDDVDAPDLVTPGQQASGPEKPKGNGSLNGGQSHASPGAVGRSAATVRSRSVQPALGPQASAELRDRLLGELTELASGDDAALWAHRSLPEKNKLTIADAGRIEEAFQTRLTTLATPTAARLEPFGRAEYRLNPPEPKTPQSKRRSPRKGIDKTALTLAEPRRVRDRDHVRLWLRSLAWFVVDNPPTPTIYALPKAEHLAARSVMNSRFHCAVDIIARSIGMATKPHGGKKLESIRCHKPARCGSKRVRSAADSTPSRACKCHVNSSG